MSHLMPEDRSSKRSRSACRKGRHFYSESQDIGVGIMRQVCEECAAVSIDLTGADEATRPVLRMASRIESQPTPDS